MPIERVADSFGSDRHKTPFDIILVDLKEHGLDFLMLWHYRISAVKNRCSPILRNFLLPEKLSS